MKLLVYFRKYWLLLWFYNMCIIFCKILYKFYFICYWFLNLTPTKPYSFINSSLQCNPLLNDFIKRMQKEKKENIGSANTHDADWKLTETWRKFNKLKGINYRLSRYDTMLMALRKGAVEEPDSHPDYQGEISKNEEKVRVWLPEKAKAEQQYNEIYASLYSSLRLAAAYETDMIPATREKYQSIRLEMKKIWALEHAFNRVNLISGNEFLASHGIPPRNVPNMPAGYAWNDPTENVTRGLTPSVSPSNTPPDSPKINYSCSSPLPSTGSTFASESNKSDSDWTTTDSNSDVD